MGTRSVHYVRHGLNARRALGLELVTYLTTLPSVHSRSQSPRSLWPAAGIESSGLVQHRKSAIHGLPVKSGKSDWLRIRKEYSAPAQKIGSGQSSRFLPQARRIVGSGDENDQACDLKKKVPLWTKQISN